MNNSKVYFSDMRSLPGTSLLTKLDKLLRQAGMDQIDFQGKYVAIKIHFGEPGNLSFLRPNWAKVVVDLVKELGGKPFLTDCNTLYVGRRKNALDHLEAAYENGYSPFSTGCHILIADGLKGNDEAIVPVNGGRLVKEAKIGRALADADIVLSLNHFKGHEEVGFGGALKNLGMGGGSRAGKMEQHCDGKPDADKDICIGCKACAKQCAHEAISFDDNRKAFIDHGKCVGCGRCIAICPVDAISNSNNSAFEDLDCKIAEYAKAVVDGKPNFHINIVNQVSPFCDCHGDNDVAIVPDVGMFASFDPVAVDTASAEAVNAMPVMHGSWLEDRLKEMDGKAHGRDNLCNSMEGTDWRVCLRHGQEIGLGTMDYDLVNVD